MAGIYKIYTDSYKDYIEFKTWADKQKLTFFDGFTVCIGESVCDLKEEYFSDGEIPIMNTSTWMDIYLIQNCKSKFVLDRMKVVYGNDIFKKYQTFDLTAKPNDDFKQNRKIIIKPAENCKFPFKKKMFRKSISKNKWFVQCDAKFWYNDETKRWISRDTPYPHNTNTAYISSTKALIRHLRKQYLPKGITFSINGRYVGERYIALIS